MAKKRSIKYVCQACGYESPKWLGRCPNCGGWNQMEEEKEALVASANHQPRVNFTGQTAEAVAIQDIKVEDIPRIPTDMEEVNHVLGGGIVPGSLILIGGDPGIGKSTLLLQVSAQINNKNIPVLYVSGEESSGQIKMRAERLGVKGADFYIYPETDVDAISTTIEKLKPRLVIIDSIQTMIKGSNDSSAGSVSQVREATQDFMRIAKTNNIAIFIVGHVTKEGNIAGPRMLEHMVDTVLYFEGDRHHTFRILRAVKNRFGSTNEIGVFEMNEGGLREVSNPSEMFLEERLAGASGSAIVASMEGTRPILAEIQCLITPTVFGNARRTASGLDHNRVSLILAVLEKRAGLLLQNQDAYFKSTGGVRLDEPAIDLALAVSVASSYYDTDTSATECFVGEIGLTGEIRRVNRIEQRVNEAVKLGFNKIYIPKNNFAGWKHPEGITIVGVASVQETLRKVFPNRN
ncbi:DNA repair protein RadA [Jeotgalibaca sp. PTS2502]|uniref:DNA repair protein RadA n=1 Tax=Jeotgalibaca arthritidis TaxID=1868794 RepID=A0A6G7K9F0_9LACT|nr:MULTISPECIES: DNA repair protein RadA [Jeotgalibaca]APZ49744.1 DNA repair protein RadA [Jeotgalibaca sp. PTS2502]QII81894.1 DNA repair protein RadA [Jeotgalibaca arthritidis]